jgi:hypothetical protein
MTRRFAARWTPALPLFALAAACESPADLSPITVEPVTIEAVGDAVQLVALGAEGALPYWESLDTTIVTVTPAGMAVAVRPGTATVRARLGSRSDEGIVTVLPPVDVRLSNVQVVTDEQGQTGLSMQVTNHGGRGYYRIEMWKAAIEGETEHRPISWQANDSEAGVGMTFGVTYWDLSDTPDWVLVYAREPLALQFDMTACVRLDGGSPCPMP